MLTLQLFGGAPKVQTPIAVPELARTQPLALLAVLALERNAVSRETLRYLFWPDEPDHSAQRNLRMALFRLREAMDEAGCAAALSSRGESVSLDPAQVTCDVWQFMDAAMHMDQDADAAATCVHIYGGPLLHRWRGVNAATFETWLTELQSRFEQQYLRALEHCAEASERAGQLELALQHAERLVQTDPLHELGHVRLMRLYAARGQTEAALRQYERCARVLREELQIEPVAQTVLLRNSIANRSYVPAPPVTLPAPVAVRLSPPALPVPANGLIGRDPELRQVVALLGQFSTRLVTLSGMGGIGKTRLAIEVAQQLTTSARFADGVGYVPLVEVRDADAVGMAVARALGLRERAGSSLTDQLETALSGLSFLLVLDNFEQVLNAAPWLSQLLGRCARLKVLVTSRAALRVYGEREVVLSPLALPDPQADATGTAASPAVQLFVERAQATRPSFVPDDAQLKRVARICERLDGLPLAIELAAARLRVLSLGELQTRLERSLDALSAGPRDATARQSTLRAAIDWSHALLSPAARQLLAQLGVFAAPFDYEAAATVTANRDDASLLSALSELCEHSLLQRRDRGDEVAIYGMLETVREYAAERLAASAGAEAVRAAHARYFAAHAQRHGEVVGKDLAAALDAQMQAHPNALAALRWAIGEPSGPARDVASALRLCHGLSRFWGMRGFGPECGPVMMRVLAQPECAQHPELVERCWYAAATLAISQGRLDETARCGGQALALARQNGHALGAGMAENMLGVAARRRGQSTIAQQHFEAALSAFRAAGDSNQTAIALNNLGGVAQDRRESSRAEQYFREALALFRTQNDTRAVAALLTNLGVTLVTGDATRAGEAIALHEESLLLRRALRDKSGEASSLRNLGDALMSRPQPDLTTANAAYCDALALLVALDDRQMIALLLDRVATVRVREGRFVLATQLLSAADAGLAALGGKRYADDDRVLYERVDAVCRASLNAPEHAAALQLGAAMSLRDAAAAV